jgi:hypothetical protein
MRRFIRSSFSAGLADRTFARKFFLIPSLGMINRGVVGCQIELKPGERARTSQKVSEISRTSPADKRENHKEYSVEASAAIKSS